jgi:protein involved in polysaccharide export with SLBB domain
MLIYSVTGEVNAPGPKDLDETVTLSTAIKMAGGFTKSANTNSVRLIRSGYPPETIRLNSGADPLIFSGDTIEVKRRSIFSR